MKKNMFKSICLVLTVCVMSAFLPAQVTVTFSSNYTDQDLKDFTAVYNHNGDVLTITEGKNLAQKIFNYCGVAGDFALNSGMSTSDMLVYTKTNDETGICMINLTTGEVAFSAGMKDLDGEMDTPDLVDLGDAKMYCDTHLNALSMYPSGGIHELDVSYFTMKALDDGVEKDYNKLVTIMTGRKLLNIPVIGNSRVNMGLGSNGAMKFLMWNWMGVDSAAIGSSDILDANLIRDRIKDQLSVNFVDAKEVIVHENYKAYYDDGISVIEPVYIMRIEVISPDDDVKEADWVTSVMVNSTAAFAHLEMAPTTPVDNGAPSTDNNDE